MYKAGAIIWALCSVGWFGIWYLTSVELAMWTALGCGIMAILFAEMHK